MKLIYIKVNNSYAFTLVDDNTHLTVLCDQRTYSDTPLQHLINLYTPTLLYLLNNTQHSLQFLPADIQVIDYTLEFKNTLTETCQSLFPSDNYVPLLNDILLIDDWEGLAIEQLYDLYKSHLTCSQSHTMLLEFFQCPNSDRGEDKLDRLVSNYDQLEQVRQQMKKISLPPASGTWRQAIIWERLIQSLQAIAQIAEVDQSVLEEMSGAILNVIDFDQPLVKKGVSLELDQLKYYYSFEMEQEMQTLSQQHFGMQAQIQYHVQLGFFTVSADQNEIYGEFMFQKDGSFLYKNAIVDDLDQSIGDIQMNIIDLEMEQVALLQEFIQQKLDMIGYRQLIEQIFEYDCLMAYAAVAKKFNYVKPEFIDNGQLLIENGRHPILEQSTDYVSNDTELNRCLLITGPNSSGKSCYLKHVGLIVYMAHIGSYVPASKCQLGIYGGIITRIVTGESSAIHKSSFKIDLDQMRLAVQACKQKKRVLVLVDEFAKGTSVEDGIGTFAATVNYINKFPQMQSVVCTHYHQAIQFLDDRFIDYIQMQQYKVCPGQATCSLGVYCASVAGVKSSVIERAQQVNDCLSKIEPIIPVLNKDELMYEAAAIELLDKFLDNNTDIRDLFGVLLKPFMSSSSSLITANQSQA